MSLCRTLLQHTERGQAAGAQAEGQQIRGATAMGIRDPRSTTLKTRAIPHLALHLHNGAQCAHDRRRLPQDPCANRGASKVPVARTSAHAPACRRIQVCKRQSGSPSDRRLRRPQEHPKHASLYRTRRRSVQKLLGGLTSSAFSI